ncbi:MAG: hypothetical protein MK135_03660, partial [Polyangiaceae bacterium]|nr:hypothetical protein [Polyangiaceae bacterium]
DRGPEHEAQAEAPAQPTDEPELLPLELEPVSNAAPGEQPHAPQPPVHKLSEEALTEAELQRALIEALRNYPNLLGGVAWGSAPFGGAQTEKAHLAAGSQSLEFPEVMSLCEEEDSNLHGSYPTSTSST